MIRSSKDAFGGGHGWRFPEKRHAPADGPWTGEERRRGAEVSPVATSRIVVDFMADGTDAPNVAIFDSRDPRSQFVEWLVRYGAIRVLSVREEQD